MADRIKILTQKTATLGIEYIKGSTDIGELRDMFNSLCAAMNADEWKPDELSFDINDLAEHIKQEPWVSKLSGLGAEHWTWDRMEYLVENFICKYWMMKKEEITTKHISDILKMANPLSKRRLVAQRIVIECIHALDKEQQARLESVLYDIALNPNISTIQQIKKTRNIEIKKYRPAFFEGFEEERYEVRTKEELMNCKLIKDAQELGEICFSYGEHSSHIMLVIQKDDEPEGCEWWVISIITNKDDAAVLKEWLPDWMDVRAKYATKKKTRLTYK